MWGTDKAGASILKNPNDLDTKRFDVPVQIDDVASRFVDNNNNHNNHITIDHVVCGPTDTAWILTDGRVWVHGENQSGHLGVGHRNVVPQPVPLVWPDPDTAPRIASVALGASAAAWIDTDGDLYTTGYGGSAFAGRGALGHGPDHDGRYVLQPTLVTSLVEDGVYARQAQVGEAHLTVLTTEGEVLTAGAGSYGRLGNFETIDQLFLEPVEILTSGVTQIAGGKSFTLALHEDGVLYGWGRNHKGQLGTGLGLAVDMYAMQAVPEPIEGDELRHRVVTQVAAGHSHAACLTESGEVFYWGDSVYLEPTRVDALLGVRIVELACGEHYTLCRDEHGKLYSFGKGKTGVLGQGGAVKQANQAAHLEALDGVSVTAISAGWKHAACLATNSTPTTIQ